MFYSRAPGRDTSGLSEDPRTHLMPSGHISCTIFQCCFARDLLGLEGGMDDAIAERR